MTNLERLKAAETDLAAAFSRYLGVVVEVLGIPRPEMALRVGVSRSVLNGLFNGRVLPTPTQWWALRRAFSATRSNMWLMASAAVEGARVGACSVETSANGQRVNLRLSHVFSLAQLHAILGEMIAGEAEIREPFVIIQESTRAGALVDGISNLPTEAALRILKLMRPEEEK